MECTKVLKLANTLLLYKLKSFKIIPIMMSCLLSCFLKIEKKLVK